MAIGIALLVWTAVVYANNPPDSRTFLVPVQFDSQGTKWTLDQPIDPVSVRVSGTKDNVAAFHESSVTARIDVSKLTHPGVQDAPIVILNHDADVTLDNPPSTVRATIDVITARQVPITPVIIKTPPAGFVPDTPTITPGSVLVNGAKNLVDQVKAEVEVDLSGFKTNYDRTTQVKLLDPAGTVVTSLGTNPSVVQVNVVINSSLTSRSVPIIVVTEGQVAPGHVLAGLTPTPQTVVITGPLTVLNGTDFIEVQVNITGLFGPVTFPGVAVNTGNEGVAANPSKVDVHVSVLTSPPPTPSPTPPPTPSPTPTPKPTAAPTP